MKYSVGDIVVLTKEYCGYPPGTSCTVLNSSDPSSLILSQDHYRDNKSLFISARKLATHSEPENSLPPQFKVKLGADWHQAAVYGRLRELGFWMCPGSTRDYAVCYREAIPITCPLPMRSFNRSAKDPAYAEWPELTLAQLLEAPTPEPKPKAPTFRINGLEFVLVGDRVEGADLSCSVTQLKENLEGVLVPHYSLGPVAGYDAAVTPTEFLIGCQTVSRADLERALGWLKENT